LSMQITRCPPLKNQSNPQRPVCKNPDFKIFSFADNRLQELGAQKHPKFQSSRQVLPIMGDMFGPRSIHKKAT